MISKLTGEFASLCESYKLAKDKRGIEREIFDFFNDSYQDKRDYSILVKILGEHRVYDLMQKAQNVYIGALVSDFLEGAVQKGFDKVASDFVFLNALYSTSESSYLYGHYIKTSLSLSGIDVFYKKPDFNNEMIDKALATAKWEYKKYLYYSVIDQIVKLSSKKTKSTVVMISNRDEGYFLNCLVELKSQVDLQDCKIVFVSNNCMNKTEAVLSNVDTFIQLTDNYGDCLPRNIGALFSNSEIVIFIEDDGIPSKDFIYEHLLIHSAKNILSVRGCCLPITNGIMPEHYWLGMHERISPPVLEGNCSFKVDEFYRIGGWGDYLFFGHGGYEICYRMLQSFSEPAQHIYSPRPILYHDWIKQNNSPDVKQLRHHALWHLLKFRHNEFYKLPRIFNL